MNYAPHHAYEDYMSFKPFTGKASMFKEKLFEGPLYGKLTYKNIVIKNIELIALDLVAYVDFSDQKEPEITETEATLLCLDPQGEEIATIDLTDLEINRDWLERVNNIFGFDLIDLIKEEASENPID